MVKRGGYVYIMSNKHRTVFYIGVTSNLFKRVHEHKILKGSLFTIKYNCTDLLYFESYTLIEEAIAREKAMKKWSRQWKIDLIKSKNPTLVDLSEEIGDYI